MAAWNRSVARLNSLHATRKLLPNGSSRSSPSRSISLNTKRSYARECPPMRTFLRFHSGCAKGGMPEMIECHNLTKRFGSFTAVDHVTFSVAKGSIFGFLGPNGSGKSTVIRMLCGILQPTEGTATVAGIDVSKASDELKASIGYMSQKFSLYDELTVNENLQFYGRLYGLKRAALRERMEELISLTHLQPYLTRRAALLSGGWRQRLAMAC